MEQFENLSAEKLLSLLRETDFALVETVLYLDAYPDHGNALKYYHNLCEKRKLLAALYEKKCGPLTVGGNESRTSWDWVKTPFPWESEANGI